MVFDSTPPGTFTSGKCYLVLEVDWKFASNFMNRDNDIYMKVSDPAAAVDGPPLPTLILYNVWYTSSTFAKNNEIVQQNYKGLTIFPAFWKVGLGASTPAFFKVTGTLTATESKFVLFSIETPGATFYTVTGGETNQIQCESGQAYTPKCYGGTGGEGIAVLMDFTGMTADSTVTAFFPVLSASGVLPNFAYVVGYEDFTSFAVKTVDYQIRNIAEKANTASATISATNSWFLDKSGATPNDDKWNLDTDANVAEINFVLDKEVYGGDLSDTPCMAGETDNSLKFTCNGAGYMYCTDWALDSNAAFTVAQGAGDTSTAASCATFSSTTQTCAVCFTAE